MLKRPRVLGGGDNDTLTAVLLFQEYFAHITGKHEAEQLREGITIRKRERSCP